MIACAEHTNPVADMEHARRSVAEFSVWTWLPRRGGLVAEQPCCPAAGLARYFMLAAYRERYGDNPPPVPPAEPEPAGRHWLDWQPGEFDTAAPPVQFALFAAPDPLGTPDMFAGDES